MKNLTCSEQIKDNLESALEELESLLAAYNHDEAIEYDHEEYNDESIYDYGLCFDYIEATPDNHGHFRFQISWGGPSSEWRFFVDLDCQPYKIEYWYMDWFDGASLNVTNYTIAKAFWEYLSESAHEIYQTAMENS